MTPTPDALLQTTLTDALTALAHGQREECYRALETLLRQAPHDMCRLSAVIRAVGQTLPTWDDPYAPLFADPHAPTPTEQGHVHTLRMLQKLLCTHLPVASAAVAKDTAENTAKDAPRTAVEKNPDAPAPQGTGLVAPVALHVSSMLYRVGLWDDAAALLHAILALWAYGTPPQEAATCWNNLGRIAEECGQLAEGIAWHRKALALRRQLLGEHSDTAFSCCNLGVALASDGQWQEAAALLQEAVDTYTRLHLTDTSEAKGAAANLAVCRRALHAMAPAGHEQDGS